MGIAIIALLLYISIIIFWAAIIKRNIAEGMIAGFAAVSLFGGAKAPVLMIEGLVSALQNEVLFASLAFILMSYLIKESGILDGILEIFNAALGGLPGGPAFVNIGLSATLGVLSGSNSANAATSGAFTAQWMVDTGWKKEIAATLIAGNGGLGAGFPPSASMFIMLGLSQVSEVLSEGQVYLGLFAAGVYQVIYRIFLVLFLIRQSGIRKSKAENNGTFFKALKKNGKSLTVFLGAVIPILLTVGPIGRWLEKRGMAEAVSSISLLTWIPMLMILIIFIIGKEGLRKNIDSRKALVQKLFPQYKNIGGVLLFAFAASEIFSKIGLAEALADFFGQLNFAKSVMVLLVGLMIVLVAGPLSSTATLTSVGLIAYSALLSVGVSPLPAVVSILVFASTEGASPPASGSIFIASGLTGANVEATFAPLIRYFVIPITLLGWLIAMEFIPLFA